MNNLPIVTKEKMDETYAVLEKSFESEWSKDVEDAWFLMAYIVFTTAMYAQEYQPAEDLIKEFSYFLTSYLVTHPESLKDFTIRLEEVQKIPLSDGFRSTDQFAIYLFDIFFLGPQVGVEKFKDMWKRFNMILSSPGLGEKNFPIPLNVFGKISDTVN